MLRFAFVRRWPDWVSQSGVAAHAIGKNAPIGNTDCPIGYGFYPLASTRYIIHMAVSYLLPCPRAALFPQGFDAPAGAGRAGLGRPGRPGASRTRLGRPGRPGPDRQGRPGLPGRAVRPVCVCVSGLARPARLAWPGPLKNKKSKMSKCQKWPPQRPFLTL